MFATKHNVVRSLRFQDLAAMQALLAAVVLGSSFGMGCGIGSDFRSAVSSVGDLEHTLANAQSFAERLPDKLDAILEKRTEELRRIKDESFGNLHETLGITTEYASEVLIDQKIQQVRGASRRTLVRALADGLKNEQLFAEFERQLSFGSAPTLPNVATPTKKVEINVMEDGSIFIEPQTMHLVGYGLNRVTHKDAWMLSLVADDKSVPVSIPDAAKSITQSGGGFHEHVDLQRLLDRKEVTVLKPGDYELVLKHTYSDSKGTKKIPVVLSKDVILPTKTVKINPIVLQYFEPRVKEEKVLEIGQYRRDEPGQEGINWFNATSVPEFRFGRYEPRFTSVKVWKFPVYVSPNGPSVDGRAVSEYGVGTGAQSRTFWIPISEDLDLWSSAMVSVDVRLEFTADKRAVNAIANAYIAEWEENGRIPRGDFTAGFKPGKQENNPIGGLDQSEYGFGIVGPTTFAESRHVKGDAAKVDITPGTGHFVKSVTGNIHAHKARIDQYAEIKIEFNDVQVKVAKPKK